MRVLLPSRTLLDREVAKVVAESTHGAFCLKPRHVDYAAPLVDGILAYTDESGESFIGVTEGVLVKAGDEVLVAVRDAITGAELGEMRDTVRRRRRESREREGATRAAAARLESVLVRRFSELWEAAGERRP